LIRSHDPSDESSIRLGVRLLDEYLEFLSGRCRPNTVLAVAFDLKVFFAVVGKGPELVRPSDVLGFMTAERTGQNSLQEALTPVAEESAGVSTRTLRRRLSSVSGLFGFLHVRGDWRPTRSRAGFPRGENVNDRPPTHSTRSAVEPGTTPGHWRPAASRNAPAAGRRQTRHLDRAANARRR
jgi:hypothetical protein